MNSNVRLGVEAVLVIVLIIALFLYFSQQQQLTDTQALQTNAESTAAALASDNSEQATQLAEIELSAAEAQAASDEQVNMAATAIADVAAISTQLVEAQAAADTASTAQAAAEAASLEQANAAATALADAGAASAQVAEVQAAADTAATAQAEAQAAAADSAQQVADLQATIDAMNAATPEPEVEATEEATAEAQTEATEEATAEAQTEATEEATAAPETEATAEATADVAGFPADVFALTVSEDYTVYTLTGEARDASLTAIAEVDAELATRLGRETSYDYAAVKGAGDYILINQQAAPAGVSTVADVADVAFRRADSSEQLTLGANEVGRGMFGENEVRYIVVDEGSLWVLTFVSADVAGNLAAFDEIVATFDAVPPPAEEESGD